MSFKSNIDHFDQWLKSNIDHFEQWNEDNIKEWLFNAIIDSDYGEIDILPEPTIEKQIQFFYDFSPVKVKERIKQGVAKAMNEWRKQAYGNKSIIILAQLSALLRASSAIGSICQILKQRKLGKINESSFQVYEKLLSVLIGFAPSDNTIRNTLELLFYSDETNPKLGALLLIGLCKCNPDEFYIYIQSFI